MTDENTEVSLFGGNVDLVDTEALTKAMEETADEGGRNGDVSFMNFSGKRGLYQIGVDKRSPDADEPFLVAIPLFELGYMAWKGGQPAGKRFANINQPKVQAPDPEEGGPFNTNNGEGWSRARSITVRSFVNGEQCYFTSSSKSGVASMSDLQRDVLAKMKAGQPCWPVINFGMSEFTAQGNKNFKPDFDVVAWLDNDDIQKLSNPDFDPMSLLNGNQEEAPRPKARRL